VNIVGNYYKPGPNTPTQQPITAKPVTLGGQKPKGGDKFASRYFLASLCQPNIGSNLTTDIVAVKSGWSAVARIAGPVYNKELDDCTLLPEFLSARIGANQPRVSAVDSRIISEALNGTGQWINDPSEVGGYDVVTTGVRSSTWDQDFDGMPDQWEDLRGLDKYDHTDGARTAANGYTNLENYLNSAAGDEVPGIGLLSD
jgi:hypothetical protein